MVVLQRGEECCAWRRRGKGGLPGSAPFLITVRCYSGYTVAGYLITLRTEIALFK